MAKGVPEGADIRQHSRRALCQRVVDNAFHPARRIEEMPQGPQTLAHGRGCGVGRTLGGGIGRGVGVGRIVAVGVAVAVAVGVGVAEGVGVGVGVPPPPSPGAWISTVIGSPVLKYPTVALAVCGG